MALAKSTTLHFVSESRFTFKSMWTVRLFAPSTSFDLHQRNRSFPIKIITEFFFGTSFFSAGPWRIMIFLTSEVFPACISQGSYYYYCNALRIRNFPGECQRDASWPNQISVTHSGLTKINYLSLQMMSDIVFLPLYVREKQTSMHITWWKVAPKDANRTKNSTGALLALSVKGSKVNKSEGREFLPWVHRHVFQTWVP